MSYELAPERRHAKSNEGGRISYDSVSPGMRVNNFVGKRGGERGKQAGNMHKESQIRGYCVR